MKKLLTMLCVAVTGAMIYAASLRDYVCVVRGNISEKNKQFLTEMSEALTTRGYKRYGEYISSYLTGSFGSGFVYYVNGKPYILTNRHVIQSAETASVTFENEDGSNSEFKELKIVYIDEDVDVAVIQLPDTFKRSGLTMNQGTVNDGDDVWSAGFPGLGNEPSWQLGKGIVSNSRAKIKQLLDPEISTLIQHTAEIDGGNSGGPLLVKNSSDPAGYRVAGINTWKAVYRENTNFSIPAALIKKTVETGIAGKKVESFEDRMKAFVKALQSDEEEFDAVSKFISDGMVEVYGKDALINVVSTAKIDPRNAVVNTFESNPIEGLRLALAYSVWSNFNSSKEKANISTGTKEDLGTAEKIAFTAEGSDPVSSEWIEEKGNWRLQKIDCVTAKDDKTAKKTGSSGKKSVNDKAKGKGFEIEAPYFLSVSGGAVYPFGGDLGMNIEAKFMTSLWSYGFFYTKVKIDDADIEGDWSSTKGEFEEKAFGAQMNLQVPLKFKKFALIPFGGVRVGLCNFGDLDNGGIYYGAEAGCEGVFIISDDFGMGLGAQYQYAKYGNGSGNNLTVYATIHFVENPF